MTIVSDWELWLDCAVMIFELPGKDTEVKINGKTLTSRESTATLSARPEVGNVPSRQV